MLTESQIRKDLEKKADSLTLPNLAKWNSTTWSNLMGIASGLSPFSETVMRLVPKSLHIFCAKSEFSPNESDQALACRALKKALSIVNSAILDASKDMYSNLIRVSGDSNLPALDDVLSGLEAELFDYDKRKMYFHAGVSMMSEQEVWLGRHHVMATGLIATQGTSPRKLSDKYFLDLATDVGILVDGNVQFNPFKIKS